MFRSAAATSGRRSSSCEGNPTGIGGGAVVFGTTGIENEEACLPTSMAIACSYCARAMPMLIAADSALAVLSWPRPEISDRRRRYRRGFARCRSLFVGLHRFVRESFAAYPGRESQRNIPPGWPVPSAAHSQDRPRSPVQCTGLSAPCCAPCPTDPAPTIHPRASE